MNEKMNESKFHAWRACIAIIYLDKKVTSEELKWAKERIANLPLTVEQRKQLENDLENGLDLNSVLPKITEKKDLGFLISTFRVLANIDKNFSVEEKKSFGELEAKILGNLNLNEIESHAQSEGHRLEERMEAYDKYDAKKIFHKIFGRN